MVSAKADGCSFSNLAPTFFFPVAVLDDSEAVRPDLLGRRFEAPPRKSRSDRGDDELSDGFVRNEGINPLPIDVCDLAVAQLPARSVVNITVNVTMKVDDDDILKKLLIFSQDCRLIC